MQFIIIDFKPMFVWERDWLLPAWCLYPFVGVWQVLLTGRSSKKAHICRYPFLQTFVRTLSYSTSKRHPLDLAWKHLLCASLSFVSVLKKRTLTIIFKYALILQSDWQNGVVIKTYIARLISLPCVLCVLCHAPSLLEDKYVITCALVEIRKI